MLSVLVLFCAMAAATSGSLGGRWQFYVNQDNTKLVSVVTDQKGEEYKDCYASGDKFIIQSLMSTVLDANVTVVNTETVEQLASLCTNAKWKGNLTAEDGEIVWEQLGLISGFFIYPGTKWCGAGNISTEYDDLGPETETDKCCRTHDFCEDFIDGYETKFELRNSSPFTKSHCGCDILFYHCLQRAQTRASSRVGRIFFNFLQMECFKQDHPVTGCRKYHGRFRRTCQEYEFDPEGALAFQWFDAKHYEPRSQEEDNEIEDSTGDVFQYMLRLADGETSFSRSHNKKL